MRKEIPILFSTPMVQALLAGRKAMTRRVVKHPRLGTDPIDQVEMIPNIGQVLFAGDRGRWSVKCPYGKPGDVLWVRETFHMETLPQPPEGDYDAPTYFYKASMKDADYFSWNPSIHMPKLAARIWLEVEEVRVERLHVITEEDAKEEGSLMWMYPTGKNAVGAEDFYTARTCFVSLWQSINGEESWKANPWVWAISFKILSTIGKPQLETALPLL